MSHLNINGVDKPLDHVYVNTGSVVKEAWEARDKNDHLLWGRADTFTGTSSISVRGYGLPVKSWEIDGNSQQSGTPAPDDPIYPDFVGKRTENVMPASPAGVHEENGLTFTSNGSGIYTVSGIASETTTYIFRLNGSFTIPIAYRQGGHGTFSLFNSQAPSTTGAPCRAQFFLGDTLQDTWSLNATNRKANNYGTMGGLSCDGFGVSISAGVEIDMQISPVFTDNDTYPDSYIPYGYKLPITSAGQTQNVYLGSVQSTRKIKKLVLTGNEDWKLSGINSHGIANFWFRISDRLHGAEGIGYCSHFEKGTQTAPNATSDGFYVGNTDALYIRVEETTADTVEKFVDYIAGKGIAVWYVLATAQTGIVNEPLMRIDSYADTLDSTQAGVVLPTVRGSNTLSVDTAVAPSSMTITGHIITTPETGIVNEPLMKIGDYADSITSTQAGITIPTTDGNTTISVDTSLAPSRFEIKVHAKAIAP
jgi:hypothetical protein